MNEVFIAMLSFLAGWGVGDIISIVVFGQGG